MQMNLRDKSWQVMIKYSNFGTATGTLYDLIFLDKKVNYYFWYQFKSADCFYTDPISTYICWEWI
jgi:hypothetical protein